MLPLIAVTPPQTAFDRVAGFAADRLGAAQGAKRAPAIVVRPAASPAPQAVRALSIGVGPLGLEKILQSNGGREDARALSADELREVEELSARDREVRNHEAAHALVGGQYAGSPTFEYTTGPDGKRYAVSGSVPIDVAPIRGDPEATIAKMETVKAAALAPSEPSGADRQVAARAEALKREAIAELNAERRREAFGDAAAVGEAAPLPGSDVIAKEAEPEFEPWFTSKIEEVVPIIGPEPFGGGGERMDIRR